MKPFDLVLAHYQEVGLKGNNRSFFERTLAANIKSTLTSTNFQKVALIPGRVIIDLRPHSDTDVILERMQRVFGLSSYSPGFQTSNSLDEVQETALQMATDATFDSFRVRARRGNSSFPASSQSVNVAIGQAIKDLTGARVDLSGAEWTCHIELVEDKAYLYSQKLRGPGGLPVGSSGKVIALLSGGIDSPVAAWKLAKRGASVEFVHFHGQPFSDASSVRQATRLAQHLSAWTMKSRLWLIPFGDIQSEIVTTAPQELRIVLYRRFMMRISESLALREGAEGLVTGESLGQVASQTLPNMNVINLAAGQLPVLRPLIGDDKLEIENVAKSIGTYEISIDPHQDCCVLFIPRRVTTAAKIKDVERAEADLDVTSLVDKGLANAEVVELG